MYAMYNNLINGVPRSAKTWFRFFFFFFGATSSPKSIQPSRLPLDELEANITHIIIQIPVEMLGRVIENW